MKLHLTLSSLLLLACFKLSAQTNAIQFGIRAGVSGTWLSRTPGTDVQIRDAEKAGPAISPGPLPALMSTGFRCSRLLFSIH
ncbi:hypothetical protein ACQ86K_33240 [Mucilaginibacter sp. P19]|uniref:hypothetical protein n=1 Tax=Mucilaginibacter sp. P19 TaxID=3423947 RepID=UPI003D671DBF